MKTNLLKAELAKAEMTQTQLAQALGITPQTLNKQINSGKMGIEQAEQISRELRLTKEKAVEIFLPGI